ncbi:MAG TPA: serine/threonine-protein kinase [Labilithrix sp.]
MAALRPGMQIDGRYVIVDPLGAGAQGIVYRAEDVFLGRLVAIKVVSPEAVRDPKIAERFASEARALASLKNDHVVGVFSYGEHGGQPFFVMEYVEGETLESIIEEHAARGTTVDIDRALTITNALARGLHAAHERRVIHRDVKPGNVIVENGTGRPVLVDFGLARRAGSTPRMSVGGTPWYMAPEQARDRDGSETTSSADLYALACSAFELITGRPVFEGRDVYDVLLAHQRDEAPALSVYQPDFGPLDAVFARARAKTPRERPPSCLAFAEELEAAGADLQRASAPTRTVLRSRFQLRDPRAPHVLALVADDAFARRLEKTVERAMPGSVWARFTAGSDLVSAFERKAAVTIVIDEDATTTSPATLVDMIRKLPGGAEARVIVLSREWRPSPSARVRSVPKPVNMQLFASVLTS